MRIAKTLSLLLLAACVDPPPPKRPSPPPDATEVVPSATPAPTSMPPKPVPLASLPDDPADPRSCLHDVPSQSCIPGGEQVDWACRSDCGDGCSKCAKECKDGACLDECLRTRDRCATKCPEQVKAFYAEVASNYGCKSKTPALELCQKTVACSEKCQGDAWEACREKCKKTILPGCSDYVQMVAGSGSCMPLDLGP